MYVKKTQNCGFCLVEVSGRVWADKLSHKNVKGNTGNCSWTQSTKNPLPTSEIFMLYQAISQLTSQAIARPAATNSSTVLAAI